MHRTRCKFEDWWRLRGGSFDIHRHYCIKMDLHYSGVGKTWLNLPRINYYKFIVHHSIRSRIVKTSRKMSAFVTIDIKYHSEFFERVSYEHNFQRSK